MAHRVTRQTALKTGAALAATDGLPFATSIDGTPKNFEVSATCPARWHPDDCE